MALKNNTWKLNQWYDQNVAGNVSYSGTSELFTWGNNHKGYLGQNNTTRYSSPTQIPGATWSALSNGNYSDSLFMMATKTDGTLWTWGNGSDGKLGQNSETEYSSPVQIPGTTWGSQINRSIASSFAIKTDGTLWAWGANSPSYGQLGHNNKTTYSSPVQVGSDTTWKNISSMGYAGMATKTDGTLWTWGVNNFGQLGINDTTNYSSPKQVPGTSWNIVSGGGQFGAAIKTDGTLWMWGVNEYGMLGQNNKTKYSSPIQIPGSWSKIGLCNISINAIKTDGTLWAWGGDNVGTLGQNQSTEPRFSSPVQIGSDTTWNDVVGGHTHVIATKTDGTLWTWGNGGNGIMGQNDVVTRSSPIQIPGSWSTGDKKIASIYYSSAALTNV